MLMANATQAAFSSEVIANTESYTHSLTLTVWVAEDSFGNLLSEQNPEQINNPWKFSSKYWDRENGKGYWGYRWYDSSSGRFVSKDPLMEYGFKLQMAQVRLPSTKSIILRQSKDMVDVSEYLFVGNAPQNKHDILGLAKSLDDQCLRYGLLCCESCEIKEIRKALSVSQAIRNAIAGQQDLSGKGYKIVAGGQCVSQGGYDGQKKPGKWKVSVEVPNVESCVGYCTWIHEDTHRRMCENNPFGNYPWDEVQGIVLGGGDKASLALIEVPAYDAEIKCLQNKIRYAEEYEKPKFGSLAAACMCCLVKQQAFMKSIGEW